MLPKKYRLKSKDDFQRAYKQGRFFSLGGITINFVDNDTKISRFGFVIGKAYSKNSAERNRIRRVLRSSIVKILKRIVGGKDFVIGIKKLPPGQKIDPKKTSEIIEKSLTKNKLLEN